MEKVYKLMNTMNMKILQICVVAAMAMGDLHVTYASSARSGFFKRTRQQNAGMEAYNILRQELVDGTVSGDVRSWIEKLCVILNCNGSDISVYRLWGTGSQSENSLSVEDTLLSIAELIYSKRGNNSYLSPKNFITPDRLKGNQHDWEMDFHNSSIQKCFVRKTHTMNTIAQNRHALFGAISTAAKVPVLVIDDIYEGNSLRDCLGKWPGGFRNFFNRLNIYQDNQCKTIDGGLLFDDDIQKYLQEWIPFWEKGWAWFFVIYQGDIYMIYRGKIDHFAESGAFDPNISGDIGCV
ncbi:MAG: hypothetical protein LBQ03_00705 [Puniceicoccales bacterium]|jgi:hypothetical protein|nr:hypothetical protein [Puniceicoccales bacterium]